VSDRSDANTAAASAASTTTTTTTATAPCQDSTSCAIQKCKNKINQHEKEWELYKKYTNPYEFIHTPIPPTRQAVSTIRPISRAYFKFVEIWHTFLSSFPVDEPIQTFHLAEAPGSFIEALANIRNYSQDVYHGMTLCDAAENRSQSVGGVGGGGGEEDMTLRGVPTWRKIKYLLRNHSNIVLEYGHDLTGNMLSICNFDGCVVKYQGSMDLITADGGFDFSKDFNNQELSMEPLLFAQIAFAVAMQKKGGHFVLKVFDCFHDATVDLLVLLSSMYRECYITKPLTSRFGNSEKYVVCKHFMWDSATCIPLFRAILVDVIDHSQRGVIPDRFLLGRIPLYFQTKLDEYNAVFCQQQMENILLTLQMVEQKQRLRMDQMVQQNVQKCTSWCIKYNIPYTAES